MNLRQRIRKEKINCLPWKFYKGEIRSLPISSQTLFSKNGTPWDILEIALKEEGYLLPNEQLWNVLSDINRLTMDLSEITEANIPWDDSWSEDDFIYFYENL